MPWPSRLAIVAVLLLVGAPSAALGCWDEAARRYGVSAALLYAIARVESDLDPKAVNRRHLERTGSYDIGLMQINSRHLPALARHGIGEAELFDPCTNVQVGAWLLAGLFARHGVTWDAVGAYNAACVRLPADACARTRAQYAWRVYRQLPAAAGGRRASVPSPVPGLSTVQVAP